MSYERLDRQLKAFSDRLIEGWCPEFGGNSGSASGHSIT